MHEYDAFVDVCVYKFMAKKKRQVCAYVVKMHGTWTNLWYYANFFYTGLCELCTDFYTEQKKGFLYNLATVHIV